MQLVLNIILFEIILSKEYVNKQKGLIFKNDHTNTVLDPINILRFEILHYSEKIEH